VDAKERATQGNRMTQRNGGVDQPTPPLLSSRLVCLPNRSVGAVPVGRAYCWAAFPPRGNTKKNRTKISRMMRIHHHRNSFVFMYTTSLLPDLACG